MEIGADLSGIVLPWHRQNAIETTCQWGGLVPLPESATDIEVTTNDSMFTRGFRITFTASDSAIDDWAKKSLRLGQALPKTTGAVDHYEIYPGEVGSNGGWVEIDRAAHRVKIQMSWS